MFEGRKVKKLETALENAAIELTIAEASPEVIDFVSTRIGQQARA